MSNLKIPSRSESEDETFAPLPPGTYDFRIREATEDARPKGTLLKLRLAVMSPDQEHSRVVFDNLVDWGFKHRLLHFFECIGLDDVLDGEQPFRVDDLAGRYGKCKLRIGEWNGRKRNEVVDYVSPGSAARSRVKGDGVEKISLAQEGAEATESVIKEGDIPF